MCATTPTRRSRRATRSTSAGAGRALSARRGAGRLHGAQRHDLHAAARVRLEPHRAAHRRRLVARASACAAMPSASRTAGTGRCGARCAMLGLDPDRARLGWLAAHREVACPLAVLGDDELWCSMLLRHRAHLHPQPADAAARAPCAGCAAAGDPNARQLARRQLRGPLLHAAVDARPSPRRHARAAARGRGGASGPPAHRARCAGHARPLR